LEENLLKEKDDNEFFDEVLHVIDLTKIVNKNNDVLKSIEDKIEHRHHVNLNPVNPATYIEKAEIGERSPSQHL
jgi:hypothetical protein